MKPVTEPILRAAANAFDFGGPVVCDARHYGEGHINDTFVVWREDHAKRFILQRINTDTFTDPVGLMENICGVTRHLREKILAAGGDPARETLNVIPTLSGAACHLDAEGGAWRAYDFVEDTIFFYNGDQRLRFFVKMGRFQLWNVLERGFRINNFVHLPLHSRFVNTIFQRFGLGRQELFPHSRHGDEIKRFHNAAVIFFRKQNSVAVFGADVQRFIVLYGLLYILESILAKVRDISGRHRASPLMYIIAYTLRGVKTFFAELGACGAGAIVL